MADDLGVQFFTTANAQLEGVTKWHLIALALLAYLHLALVVPFAEQSKRKADVDRELAANRTLSDHLAPIVNSVTGFEEVVRYNIEGVAIDLRQDLIARFRVLSDTMGQLVQMGPDRAAGAEGEQLFKLQPDAESQSQQMQLQQQAPSPLLLAGPTLDPMPATLRARVASASEGLASDEEYARELGAYISESVIAPAFKQANDTWSAQRSTILGEADTLDRQLQDITPSDGTASAQLGELKKQIAALRDRAESLTFAPPSGSDWWRTVAGKESSIDTMIEAIRKVIEEVASQEGVLRTLTDEVKAIIDQKELAAKELTAELAALDQQAKELQAQLGEIGGPLKVIAIKLHILAPLLPLIIGLAAAAIAVWRAEFLQRMRFAASLVEGEPQGRAVRGWLQSAAGGSVRRLAAKEIAVGALMIAWVLVAARSAWNLPAPFASHVTIATLALVVVAGGCAYHWYRSNQALSIACRDCVSQSPTPDPRSV